MKKILCRRFPKVGDTVEVEGMFVAEVVDTLVGNQYRLSYNVRIKIENNRPKWINWNYDTWNRVKVRKVVMIK